MKNSDNNIKTKPYLCLYVLGTLAVSFILLSVTSIATSPFYNEYGLDSLVYKLAGAEILDGLVMFRDIFQQKGALFLFVEAIGELICRIFNNDRIGTFLIQYINLSASVLIAGRCTYSFAKQKGFAGKRLWIYTFAVSALTAIFWSCIWVYGNQVEEFAVIYQIIGVVIGIRYCMQIAGNNDENSYDLKPVWGFVYGVLIAATVFYKPTTSAVIGACVLYIGCTLLIHKRFSNAIKNIGTGILGIAVVTIPLFLYYYLNDALGDMLEQCFLFNFRYLDILTEEPRELIHRIIVFTIILGLPIVSLFFCAITKFKPICVFSLVISVCNFAMLMVTAYSNMCYIEVEVAVFFAVVLCLFELKGKWKYLRVVAIAGLLIISLVFTSVMYIHHSNSLITAEEWQEIIDKTDNFAENTEDLIDKTDNTNIMCVTDTGRETFYFYYKMQMYPFTAMYDVGFSQIYNQDYVDEFYDELENNPPQYIVIENTDGELGSVYDELLEKAQTDYSIIYSDDAYILYELV